MRFADTYLWVRIDEGATNGENEMNREQELIERYDWYGPHLAYLGSRDDFKSERANLSCANLMGANLRLADLSCADLMGANLRLADLSCADLRDANLRLANLRDANLMGANLRDANLSCTDLSCANLMGANLRLANLRLANLRDANLSNAKSNSVCRMDFGGWSICIRENETSIGCQTKENAFWLRVEPKDVKSMGDGAQEWWEIHGDAIKATIKCVMEK
jgi:hypothetical protein